MTKKERHRRQRAAYLRGLSEKSNVKLTPMWDHEVNPPKKGPFKPETHKEWKARQPKDPDTIKAMNIFYMAIFALAVVWLLS